MLSLDVPTCFTYLSMYLLFNSPTILLIYHSTVLLTCNQSFFVLWEFEIMVNHYCIQADHMAKTFSNAMMGQLEGDFTHFISYLKFDFAINFTSRGVSTNTIPFT